MFHSTEAGGRWLGGAWGAGKLGSKLARSLSLSAACIWARAGWLADYYDVGWGGGWEPKVAGVSARVGTTATASAPTRPHVHTKQRPGRAFGSLCLRAHAAAPRPRCTGGPPIAGKVRAPARTRYHGLFSGARELRRHGLPIAAAGPGPCPIWSLAFPILEPGSWPARLCPRLMRCAHESPAVSSSSTQPDRDSLGDGLDGRLEIPPRQVFPASASALYGALVPAFSSIAALLVPDAFSPHRSRRGARPGHPDDVRTAAACQHQPGRAATVCPVPAESSRHRSPHSAADTQRPVFLCLSRRLGLTSPLAASTALHAPVQGRHTGTRVGMWATMKNFPDLQLRQFPLSANGPIRPRQRQSSSSSDLLAPSVCASDYAKGRIRVSRFAVLGKRLNPLASTTRLETGS